MQYYAVQDPGLPQKFYVPVFLIRKGLPRIIPPFHRKRISYRFICTSFQFGPSFTLSIAQASPTVAVAARVARLSSSPLASHRHPLRRTSSPSLLASHKLSPPLPRRVCSLRRHHRRALSVAALIAIVTRALSTATLVVSAPFVNFRLYSDAVLARVAIEKRKSIIKAWEESEKSRAENKTQKKLSSISSSENSKIAFTEDGLKKIHEHSTGKIIVHLITHSKGDGSKDFRICIP